MHESLKNIEMFNWFESKATPPLWVFNTWICIPEMKEQSRLVKILWDENKDEQEATFVNHCKSKYYTFAETDLKRISFQVFVWDTPQALPA